MNGCRLVRTVQPLSLEANDLVSGQSDELVEVELDVLPPVASVSAVGLSRIAGASCRRRQGINLAHTRRSSNSVSWIACYRNLPVKLIITYS